MVTYINNRLDHLLDDFFVDSFVKNCEVTNRQYNWEEQEDKYVYESNLAGFKKENVKININNNILSVKAEQENREFSKHYSIPKRADASSLKARLEDGMLYLTINKKESEKSREVVVE